MSLRSFELIEWDFLGLKKDSLDTLLEPTPWTNLRRYDWSPRVGDG